MSKLASNQNKAIEALMLGLTHEASAAAAGVTSRTLTRWKSDPDFSQELEERGRLVLTDATTRLKASVNDAIDVLRDVMASEIVTAAVRVRAATAVIDSALKLVEIADVIERLDAIEAAINEK